ncbi:MAG: UvrD-helicase domain-containing protein [Myxococcales bacterium]|nr:UvrD-helicase domain-containing protein [Myxococcales bacterium]
MYGFARNAVVVASAGTGKTHALVGMLVHTLLGETELGAVSPSRVVATTFSRRAAREIRARLALALDALGEAPESSPYWPVLQDTRSARGLAPRSVESVAQGARAASRGASEVFVGTLHGFALSLLGNFSLEVGRPGGIVVVDEADFRARVGRAIARAVEARAAEDGPSVRALVGLAGGIDALVSRLAHTFASFEELGLRVRDLALAPDDARVLERRWLDLAARVRGAAHLPRYEAAARAFATLDDRVSFDAAREVLAQLAAVRSLKNDPDEVALGEFFEGLRGNSKSGKLEAVFAAYQAREQFALAGRQLLALLGACERELDAAREAADGLSFGELLAALERLLASDPQVAEEIGARYDVLLVDEFQDTSRLQKRLLELLWASPPGEGVAGVRPTGLFVVGDRKQSIYGFRGADVSVFAELCVGLAGEPAREKLRVDEGAVYTPAEPRADFFPLRTNRRSSPELLSFINAFSARVFEDAVDKRELFELEYSPDIEDLLAPSTPPAPSPLDAQPPAVWLRPPLPKRGSTTRRDDARVVTRVIQELTSGRRPSALPAGASPRYKDCAVLALTNDMLDEQAYALAEVNVPYVLAGKSFYKAREVLDLAALLALLLDPNDALAALTVLRGPLAAVSDETLVGMTERGKGLRRVDGALLEGTRAALIHEGERPRVAQVVEVVERLGRLLPRVGAGSALREAVRTLRLEEILSSLPRGRSKVLNVRKFLSMADEADDPRALVARVLTRAGGTDDEGEAAAFSEEDDAVRLLTVHASKGLDFKVVFVPQMGALVDASRAGGGSFGIERTARGVYVAPRLAHPRGLVLDSPAYERTRAMGQRRDRAERRRLLYVAMTRASHMLFPVGARRAPKKTLGDAHATCGAATLEDLVIGPAAATFAVEDVELPSREGATVSPLASLARRSPRSPSSPRASPGPAGSARSRSRLRRSKTFTCARGGSSSCICWGYPSTPTSLGGRRAPPPAKGCPSGCPPRERRPTPPRASTLSPKARECTECSSGSISRSSASRGLWRASPRGSCARACPSIILGTRPSPGGSRASSRDRGSPSASRAARRCTASTPSPYTCLSGAGAPRCFAGAWTSWSPARAGSASSSRSSTTSALEVPLFSRTSCSSSSTRSPRVASSPRRSSCAPAWCSSAVSPVSPCGCPRPSAAPSKRASPTRCLRSPRLDGLACSRGRACRAARPSRVATWGDATRSAPRSPDPSLAGRRLRGRHGAWRWKGHGGKPLPRDHHVVEEG